MIHYKITINDSGRVAEATIQSKRPLVGDEPVVKKRFEALADLTEPEDSYTTTLKGLMVKAAKKQRLEGLDK